MSSGQDQDRGLAARVGDLERRVALLEGHHSERAPLPIVDKDKFWALARLAERTGPEFDRDGVAGSLLYAGRATTPGGGDLIWQAEHPLPGVLAEGWEDAAAVLAALGNPFRNCRRSPGLAHRASFITICGTCRPPAWSPSAGAAAMAWPPTRSSRP